MLFFSHIRLDVILFVFVFGFTMNLLALCELLEYTVREMCVLEDIWVAILIIKKCT